MLFHCRHPRLLVPLALAGLLVLNGCGKSEDPSAKGAKSGRGGGAAPVLVGPVHRQKVPVVIDAIGAVEPLRTTAVRSQVNGTLRRIAIREGQDVKEGDLLFEIDPRPFENALRSAQADLQKAQVQLENARAQVARYRSLDAGQMISKEQFQKIQDDARALEAEVLAADSRVANAKLQLEYCSIRAPLAGRTGNINVDEGDLVRANEPGALLTINQVSPINVSFGVPQQYLAAIHRHQSDRALPVRITPPGLAEAPEIGELTFIDNSVDSATGTIRLKATFANAQHRLWPGQFAKVALTLAEPEVLTVAASAVQLSQSGQHVYVVSAEKIAELRPVSVERTHEHLAVITRGLAEGETVVIDGQLRVVPGRPVEIKSPPGAGAPAAVQAHKPDGKSRKES